MAVPRRLFLRTAAAGALAAGAAAVAALVLEAGLRLSGAQPPFLYELREDVCAVHVPNLHTWVRGPGYAVEASFNSAGYRDVERDVAKAPGTFRVALLGDSFVEALQVSFEESAGQVLERTLGGRLQARRVEVLNFGSSGFGTACSYLTLRNGALRYRPDLVLLAFYVGNDVYDNHPELAVEPNNAFFRRDADGSLRVRPIAVSDGAVKRWLRRHSRLAGFVRDRIRKMAAVQRLAVRTGVVPPAITAEDTQERLRDRRRNSIYLKAESPLVAEAWALTESGLAAVRELVRQAGCPVVVAIIPTAESIDARAADTYLAALGVGPDAVDFARPTRRLVEILERLGVPYVDLGPVFRESRHGVDELYLPVDRHWTPLGNRVAGETLAAFIGARLRAAAPPA